jgi:hypothetical protein
VAEFEMTDALRVDVLQGHEDLAHDGHELRLRRGLTRIEQEVEERRAARRRGVRRRGAGGREAGGQAGEVEEVVLAHVEVLEALDTGMVDCHKFLYETHVHFALLDMKLLLVHYSEIAVV